MKLWSKVLQMLLLFSLYLSLNLKYLKLTKVNPFCDETLHILVAKVQMIYHTIIITLDLWGEGGGGGGVIESATQFTINKLIIHCSVEQSAWRNFILDIYICIDSPYTR